jgi:hypothetical protein
MYAVAIRVIFPPILKSMAVPKMDQITIGVVFAPLLISSAVSGIDNFAVGVVFADGFDVAHCET